LTGIIADLIGDSGRVFSVDKSRTAIAAATANIRQRPVLECRVTFIEADCLKLEWKVFHDSKSLRRLMLKNEYGDFQPIDMILIELPLLPYFGSRQLHLVETPYLEHTKNGGFITETIWGLIRILAPFCIECSIPIFMPICASNESEQESAISELNKLSASQGYSWQAVGSVSGFIRCLQFSNKVTPK
jgi:hypothetical protein